MLEQQPSTEARGRLHTGKHEHVLGDILLNDGDLRRGSVRRCITGPFPSI